MSESEHFVQFYETDNFLLDSLNGFIGKGISAGDACIVVATEAHREGLETRLRDSGLDVDAARSSGQFISLDAGETLSSFMIDGQPDAVLFRKVVGDLITRASLGRSRVRIFGEMVALLWAEHKQDAAIHLERLWNDLGETHPFLLFCAYSMNGFNGDVHAAPLVDVCTTHTRVIPAESYTALHNPDERLRTILELQQKARSLQAVKDKLEALLTREQIARAEAESANRLKDEFLATVSHELRTPLTAIMGWAHMLLHGNLDEATVIHAVQTIERNAKSQAQLVEDILDVSRVVTGKLNLNIAPVDASSVINAAIDSVQLAANSKGIKLEVTLDPSARHINGDAGRLQQVVWNLLSNSIKFTPPGGSVQVRLERADTDVQIRISDTGEGISQEFLPFIFDRFRQADGTSTRRHGGLGLGLAIVRHLVELHGGTVSADSAGEGLGTTFTIRLPLAQTNEQGLRGKETKPPLSLEGHKGHLPSLPTLDGIKILLVDDERDTLKMLSVILTEYKATVQIATSVAEAFEVLQWYKPDVLVSDLAMPEEDGYTLINKFREFGAKAGRQIPAVALTAYVRVEDRARALSAGFNMFVPKPVEPVELINAIANLTEAGPNRLAV
jgi:Signal transduction histidine kinase